MKTVLITGGSTGIGSEIVKTFSGAGYIVFFTYNTHEHEALELAKQTGSHPLKCNIKNKSEILELKKQIHHIDVLVNNAGISCIKMFCDLSEEEIDNILNVDLKGAILTTQVFLPYMISQKKGRIINIGSMWGTTGASCEVAYSAAKAGLIGFTKALAKEVGPSGITVNCISPGLIDTAMNQSITDDAKSELINETPVCRMGIPGDVANVVLFLASDDSSFITGANIPVDGGYTI